MLTQQVEQGHARVDVHLDDFAVDLERERNRRSRCCSSSDCPRGGGCVLCLKREPRADRERRASSGELLQEFPPCGWTAEDQQRVDLSRRTWKRFVEIVSLAVHPEVIAARNCLDSLEPKQIPRRCLYVITLVNANA